MFLFVKLYKSGQNFVFKNETYTDITSIYIHKKLKPLSDLY